MQPSSRQDGPAVATAIQMAAGERNRRILLTAGAGIFQRALQLGSTFILLPVLLHVLGQVRFGIWGAAASLAWLTGLVDFGTGAALVTLVARANACDSGEQARKHLAGALGFGFALTVLVALPAALALTTSVQEQTACYLIVLIGLALNVPVSTANNVWLALQKGYVSGFWESVQALATLFALLAVSRLTKDLRIYVAVVYGALVFSNLGSLIHLLITHPQLRPDRAALSWTAVREMGGHGMMYFSLAIAGGFNFFLDNILALALLGPEASARMTIAMRICMTAIGLLVVLSQPLWPAFAEAAARHDGQWVRKGIMRGAGVLVGLTAMGSFALVAWGQELLRWWLRANIGIGRDLLIAIAAWTLAQALSRVPNLLLNGLSIIRFQILVSSLATTLALGLKFVLAPRLGVAGILWGTTIAMACIVIPMNAWRIRRWSQECGGLLAGVRTSYLQFASAAVPELSVDELATSAACRRAVGAGPTSNEKEIAAGSRAHDQSRSETTPGRA